LTDAEIKAAIYFSTTGDDLRVIYNIPGEAAEFAVPTPTVGHVIVRALRTLHRNRARVARMKNASLDWGGQKP
jgi:hypothetical protein